MGFYFWFCDRLVLLLWCLVALERWMLEGEDYGFSDGDYAIFAMTCTS
jgi:hypothetical protein